MNKKVLIGAGLAMTLLVVIGAGVFATQWDTAYDEPVGIPFAPGEDGVLSENSLNYSVFEDYGPLLLVLSILMFGAIVGGVCIAREEDEYDDSD
ncbi:MAG: hypothetical protein RBQ77_01300 [Candidatus Methanomethylophilaceae archaeon]|jgi:NADH:ubiquinone oxidoreductase subunit 6 (subunit J)|nr:hypothetical protein [Candidatus Methanomethylophilaceae archaeon]NLF33591.1 hypothetical protein [Thermoplasmatales archaeon]